VSGLPPGVISPLLHLKLSATEAIVAKATSTPLLPPCIITGAYPQQYEGQMGPSGAIGRFCPIVQAGSGCPHGECRKHQLRCTNNAGESHWLSV
jgi:hypothetical protein